MRAYFSVAAVVRSDDADDDGAGDEMSPAESAVGHGWLKGKQ